MSLTLTYWKERPRSQQNRLTLQSPGETTPNVTEALILLSEVKGVFLKRWPLPSHHPFSGSLVTLCRVESEKRRRTALANEEREKRHRQIAALSLQWERFRLTLEVRWPVESSRKNQVNGPWVKFFLSLCSIYNFVLIKALFLKCWGFHSVGFCWF